MDNAAIAELNNQYRNKPMPTDVLSFPLGKNGVYDVDENNGCKMLGDIVISMERAQEQATLYGHPLQREVAFLTVHSMLRLLGYGAAVRHSVLDLITQAEKEIQGTKRGAERKAWVAKMLRAALNTSKVGRLISWAITDETIGTIIQFFFDRAKAALEKQ